MTTTTDALALAENFYRLAQRHTFPPGVPLAAVYRVDLGKAADDERAAVKRLRAALGEGGGDA